MTRPAGSGIVSGRSARGGGSRVAKMTVVCVGTIPPYKPGDKVEVEQDANGTPKDFDWRRRLLMGDVVLVGQKKASNSARPTGGDKA